MHVLAAPQSHLVIVDIQERLAPAIDRSESAVKATLLLISAAGQLSVPVTVTEQYPKGLGATIEPIKTALGGSATVIEKMHFSAMREPTFARHLNEAQRPSLVICGMEAHVCVLQTALDAKAAGYDVSLVADGVGSRAPASVEIALRRMEREGVRLVTAEMVVFEWLERAGTSAFKAIAPLLK